MGKLSELLALHCPDGVEFKTIGQISTDMYRGSGIRRDQITDAGTPCVRYGEIYTTYGIWFTECISHTNPHLVNGKKYFTKGDVLFAITGENVEEIGKSTVYLGEDLCLAGGDIVVMKHEQNPKYLSYALSTAEAQAQKSKGRVKSKVVHTSIPSLKEIILPVPPLLVQEEIVRVLDTFTELEARIKQYEYYRRLLLLNNDKAAQRPLSSIGNVRMCKRIFKDETSAEGDVPFYKIGTFGKSPDAFISLKTYEEYRMKYPFPKKGDILFSAAGTIGKLVVYDGEPAYFQDSNIVWIDNNEHEVINPYLYFVFSMNLWNPSLGGTISRLYNPDIAKTKIPVPPIEEQLRVVALLDRFDTLVHDLQGGLPAEINARRRQYQYYRDRLLSFPEKAA